MTRTPNATEDLRHAPPELRIGHASDGDRHGEVLVSGTVKDLVVGSGIDFTK